MPRTAPALLLIVLVMLTTMSAPVLAQSGNPTVKGLGGTIHYRPDVRGAFR